VTAGGQFIHSRLKGSLPDSGIRHTQDPDDSDQASRWLTVRALARASRRSDPRQPGRARPGETRRRAESVSSFVVSDYPKNYPGAKIYGGAPGLDTKRRDLHFNAILGDIPPPVWSGQIDQIVFRAFGALNETIFFDNRSRTALFTDLMFNVNHCDSALTRIVLRLDGGFGSLAVPRTFRLPIRMRRRLVLGALACILERDFDRLTVAHGDVVDVPDPVQLKAGDCFVLPSGRPFRLATDLTATPVDFRTFLPTAKRTHTPASDGSDDCFFAGGDFAFTRSHASILLDVLPPIVHIQKESDRVALRWCIERMTQEIHEPQPGGSLIAEHVAYMMLIQALRLHLAEGLKGGVGFFFGSGLIIA
jgi:hypothetical protein